MSKDEHESKTEEKILIPIRTEDVISKEVVTLDEEISNFGGVSWKYLRKFTNDVMTGEKLNIPEGVSDFIEGRVHRSIGARHYMQLKRKAIAFYPRYVQFANDLRKKPLNDN